MPDRSGQARLLGGSKSSRRVSACELRALDIRRLLAFRALRNVEANFLTFFQCLESVHGDGRKVSEQIFAAAIWSDKAKTFGIVKPFNCAGCHSASFNVTQEFVDRKTSYTLCVHGIHVSAMGVAESITCHLVTMVAKSVRNWVNIDLFPDIVVTWLLNSC